MIIRPSLTFALLLSAALALGRAASAQPTVIEGAEPEPVPAAESMAEWPCVQRKVETLTVTQFWDGPPVEALKGWDKDPDVSLLIETLASRRVPVAQAEAALKTFADSQPGDSRDARLTLLFAGLFEKVNNERKTVVTGIGRYQKSQKQRSAELERQGTEIADLEVKAGSDEKAAADLEVAQEHFAWASRIFQERQTSVPLACELPVLIEQRLYGLAKSIRALMKG